MKAGYSKASLMTLSEMIAFIIEVKNNNAFSKVKKAKKVVKIRYSQMIEF